VIVSEAQQRLESRFLPRRVVQTSEVDVLPGQTGYFEVLTTCNMLDLSSDLRRTSLAPGDYGAITITDRWVFKCTFAGAIVRGLGGVSAFPESFWRIPNEFPKSRCEMALACEACAQRDVSNRKICFR